MRVVQLIDSLNAGGAERMAINFANLLAEQNVPSYLAVTRTEGVLKSSLNNEVGYLFIQKKKVIDVKAILKFISWLKNNKIDIIHAHSSSFFFATLVKLFYPKIKIIWHDHYGNRANDNKDKSYLKFCSYFFSVILTVNFELKLWAECNLKCNEVKFMPNFVLNPNSLKITKLKGEKGKRLVFLANLKSPKNHLTFIKAFYQSKINEKGYTLHLIGKKYKDYYQTEIEDYIKLNKIENSIYLYDSCIDINNILLQSDIGVLASTYEGFPVSLIEYAYAELYVISTNIGFCKQLIKNKVNGYLFNPNDIFDIINSLKLIVEKVEFKDEMNKRFKNEVLNNYNSISIYNRIFEIYNTIIK